jgi:hypothetical protein
MVIPGRRKSVSPSEQPCRIVIPMRSNGHLRTFNKTTGVADGVIDADSDVFFASVVTPPGAGEISFTTDPQVRYDRLSGRWFLVMIDVTWDPSSRMVTRPNRVLFALNDAASNGTISGGTVWTFHQFQGDATLFTDYPSLGIDASALYIGGYMLTLAGNFDSTNGYVIPKAPLLTNSPPTIWVAAGMVPTSSSPGPYAPRGVDNYDPNNVGATAQGYFIGVDNATFNTLMLRRVTNPGSVGPPPTITGNIAIATPLTTSRPVLVPHLGNNDAVNGRLDSIAAQLLDAIYHGFRSGTRRARVQYCRNERVRKCIHHRSFAGGYTRDASRRSWRSRFARLYSQYDCLQSARRSRH